MSLAVVLFGLLLALFLAHEMDAQARHEWRMFPVLRSLPDDTGRRAFLILHVPLVAAILWASYGAPAVSSPARAALAAFAILHIALHWLYRDHPANEFGNPLSQALIWASGLAGAAYLSVVALR